MSSSLGPFPTQRPFDRPKRSPKPKGGRFTKEPPTFGGKTGKPASALGPLWGTKMIGETQQSRERKAPGETDPWKRIGVGVLETCGTHGKTSHGLKAQASLPNQRIIGNAVFATKT